MSLGRQDGAILLLRAAVGGLLLPHGLAKLLGWWGGPGLDGFQGELADFGLPSDLLVAFLLALVQTLSGVLLIVGLCTRTAAMAAASFLAATIALNAENGWFWMEGGVEYPVLWTSTALAIAWAGPGRWSLDRMRLSLRWNTGGHRAP